jgi:hypothetical protein
MPKPSQLSSCDVGLYGLDAKSVEQALSISAPARETPGGKHRGVYCQLRGSWWRLRLPPAQSRNGACCSACQPGRWPLAAAQAQIRHRPANATWPRGAPPLDGERAFFWVFLLAIYYFHLECLGGQYVIAATIHHEVVPDIN